MVARIWLQLVAGPEGRPPALKAAELLDDLGELTANMGGHVIVIPADLMPVQTGLAATYRH